MIRGQAERLLRRDSSGRTVKCDSASDWLNPDDADFWPIGESPLPTAIPPVDFLFNMDVPSNFSSPCLPAPVPTKNMEVDSAPEVPLAKQNSEASSQITVAGSPAPTTPTTPGHSSSSSLWHPPAPAMRKQLAAEDLFRSAFSSELTQQLLSHLTVGDRLRMEVVCKSWRSSLSEPLLWKHLDFSGPGSDVLTDRALSRLLLQRRACATAPIRGMVEHLNLSGCTSVTEQCIVSIVEQCPRLKTLTAILGAPLLSTQALQRLSMTGLERPSISFDHLKGLCSALAVNQTLLKLHLDGSHVGDEGVMLLAKSLSHSRVLRSLRLVGTGIQGKGLKAIATLLRSSETLQKLELSYDTLQADSVPRLATALTLNTSLTRLSLASVRMQRSSVLELLSALNQNETLTELNLSSNAVGNEGAMLLASVLQLHPKLSSLELCDTRIGTDGALALFSALQHNFHLVSLDCGLNTLGDEAISKLAAVLVGNTTLRTLRLIDCAITAAGALSLSSALSANKALTELDIGKNAFGDVGALALANALKINTGLKVFRMHICKVGSDGVIAVMNALKQNTVLIELDISKNDFSRAAAAHAVADCLRSNLTLRCVHFCGSGLDPISIATIANAFRFNRMLRHITLGLNKIGNMGASALATALASNTGLRTLMLADGNVGTKGVLELIKACASRPGCVLDLSWNMLSDEGAMEVGNLLKSGAQLRTLLLRQTGITDVGRHALRSAVKNRPDIDIQGL
eukprot:jgi/Chlat1/999/Chrsp108S00044